MKIELNHSLVNETTFKCGGRAKFYVEVESEVEFVNLLKLHSGKLYILGGGSKTLCADQGFDGLVISTKKLCNIFVEDNLIVCESGAKLFDLHTFCANNGFSGLEWSYGIPASIGGMAVMNAGAFSHEISEFIEKVEIFENNQRKILNKNEIVFGYRSSSLKNIPILKVYLKLAKGKKSDIIEKQQSFFAKRIANQPIGFGSAGSIFKRHKDIIPSQIIDKLGLKGLKVGDAEISTKHSGFIVNLGKATATDIITLINLIKEKVSIACDIKLQEEVIIID